MRISEYKTIQKNKLAELVREHCVNYDVSLTNDESIASFLRENYLLYASEEQTYAIAFNTKMIPIGVFQLSIGKIDTAIFPIRELFQKALLLNATNIVIAHNHRRKGMLTY